MDQEQETTSELKLNYEQFTKLNSDYYDKKWTRLNETKQSISFNFAAFFFSFFWLGYRKMYAVTAFIALGYIALYVLLYAAIFYFDLIIPIEYITQLLIMLTAIFTGMFGNALYKRHAKKHFKKAKNITQDQSELDNLLRNKGGTSYLGPILSLFIFAFLIAIPVNILEDDIESFIFADDPSEEVDLVKNIEISGEYDGVEDYTFGEMYQSAFEKGQWKYLGEDEVKEVEYSGTIEIYDQPTVITILFKIISEDDVRIESVSADGDLLDNEEANLILDLVQLEHISKLVN